MSMKAEIETWVAACQLYDNDEFEASIEAFHPIEETSKILFNCGVIKATLGLHQQAIQYYLRAVALDQYLAVAYFQQGVSNFLVGEFEEAYINFNDTLLYLRGNRLIDYEQLGLSFKLYSCEVLFNRGLCLIYLLRTKEGMEDLTYAAKEKDLPDHDVIDEAIKERAEGYTVFSIPVGKIYRPSQAKVKNVQVRDYLGKARLIATANPDASGHRRVISQETWARDDRPAGQISFAATQLVRPQMSSRSHPARQQSEPPQHRNMFPPTPPPEDHSQAGQLQRAYTYGSPPSTEVNRVSTATASTATSARSHSSSRQKPQALDLRGAGSNLSSFERQERPPPSEQYRRRAPARAQSERPAESRRQYFDEDDHSVKRTREDVHHGTYNPSAERGLFGSVGADFDPRRVNTDVAKSQQSSAGQQEQIQLGDPHARNRSSSRSQTFQRQSRGERHPYLIEEDAEAEAIAEAAKPAKPEKGNTGSQSQASGSTIQLPVRSSSRAPSATRQYSQPEVQESPRIVPLKKIRIKAHGPGDDIRYVMAPSTIVYSEFLEAISRKFSLKRDRMTVKTRDEDGDLITMSDQEDLDMAVAGAKDAARREGAEMGKFEVWVTASP